VRIVFLEKYITKSSDYDKFDMKVGGYGWEVPLRKQTSSLTFYHHESDLHG
jgi:hypothetical protein